MPSQTIHSHPVKQQKESLAQGISSDPKTGLLRVTSYTCSEQRVTLLKVLPCEVA